MSLRPLRGRTLTCLLAGRGLAQTIWPVPGFRTSRLGNAGRSLTTTLHKPGIVNWPGPPFLAMFFSISPVNASNTAAISFLVSPVASAMLFMISDFVGPLWANGFTGHMHCPPWMSRFRKTRYRSLKRGYLSDSMRVLSTGLMAKTPEKR